MFIDGDKFVNQRNGKTGTVLRAHPDGAILILFDGDPPQRQKIGASTVKRWYRRVPDKIEAEAIRAMQPQERKPLPKGEKSIGEKLYKFFDRKLRSCIPEEDDLTFLITSNGVRIYRLNGRNIFEVTCSSYRLTVLCNPDHLTTALRSSAFAIFDKSRNWSLRAKFIFTTKDEYGIMEGVILSGIYGRSRRK